MAEKDYLQELRDESIYHACGVIKELCLKPEVRYLQMKHFAHIHRTARFRHIDLLRQKGIIVIPRRGVCRLTSFAQRMVLHAAAIEAVPQQQLPPEEEWAL